MTTKLSEWVLYRPPKSVSFGHQASVQDAHRAWLLTERFLAKYTTFSLGLHIELGCYGPDIRIEANNPVSRIREAREIFGPELVGSRPYARWDLSEGQLERAIAFALDDDLFPKQPLGPTSLHFAYYFHWTAFERNPFHSGDASRADRRSILGVTLGGHRVFLQPTFIFPAPCHSQVLRDFLAEIEPALPFRLRDQYFQRLLPRASINDARRTIGRTLKLPRDWRALP